MNPIIEASKISKLYHIGHQQQKAQDSVKDDIVRLIRKPVEIFTGHKLEQEKLWALKDVSFNIQQGEIVGIIGRNGSGKSTLLKVLSRITDPTSGKAVLRGRVASLLEVGTGFHPELTGRENIFLNGAILGMTRKEISRKFNEIVDFSGVEKFLDTPVKFYSSGMYVRLAFSVAAHLEPDILIVDEVLAVGDADFQEKSLGKMKEVTRDHQRTVLFVSHNLTAIQSICNRAMVMRQGKLVFDGETKKAVASYLGDSAITTGYAQFAGRGQPRNKFSFEAAELLGPGGSRRGEFASGESVLINMDYKVKQEGRDYQLAVEVWNEEGICILTTTNFDTDPGLKQQKVVPGLYKASVALPTGNLREGQYYLSISASVPGTEMLDEINHAISFRIDGDEDMKKLGQNRNGVIYQRLEWSNKRRGK